MTTTTKQTRRKVYNLRIGDRFTYRKCANYALTRNTHVVTGVVPDTEYFVDLSTLRNVEKKSILVYIEDFSRPLRFSTNEYVWVCP